MTFDPNTRTDFWNDPQRWDGVDPHKECFWMRRRVDVIDVRPKAKADLYRERLLRQVNQSHLTQLQDPTALYSQPPGRRPIISALLGVGGSILSP